MQLKTAKDPESTSSGQSPDLTLTSRPMSEEPSLWDDTDTEVRRRQHKNQVRLLQINVIVQTETYTYVSLNKTKFFTKLNANSLH